MSQASMVNIRINGTPLQVPMGEKVIESARRIGVDIPFFCYHPRLSAEAGANCRMCLVEAGFVGADGSVRMMPKPQTSCSLPASEGLVIETETPLVVEARRGVLELLLINHPLDCPICDRGGECPLQNNTLHYGPRTSRFVEEKRHFPKAHPLSEHVVFDRERCIHCARCTRFTSDISGDSQLGFLKRGADMEVNTFGASAYESRFSGNVIELCPVGALLSRDYRFRGRPWDLLTQESICTRCSNGCNIKIDHRAGRLVRVSARLNEAVNEEWTCDRGKFGMGYVNAGNRALRPLLRGEEGLREARWEEAMEEVARRLREADGAAAGVGGASLPNEDLYVWQRLWREAVGSRHLDHRMGPRFEPVAEDPIAWLAHHSMGMSIADLERARAILVIGSDLVDEQPIVFLRVRKAWRTCGTRVVELRPAASGSDAGSGHVRDFAALSARYRPGSEAALVRGILAAMGEEALLGSSASDALRTAMQGWTPERAAEECDLAGETIRAAARLLAPDGLAVIAGRELTHQPHAPQALAVLDDLLAITASAGNLAVPVGEVNAQGAMDLGILPDIGPAYTKLDRSGNSAQRILEAAGRGEVPVLWLMGVDLLNAFHDRALADRALRRCPFVVYAGHFLDETAARAHVVLPLQTSVERDGSFTSCERRVQRFQRAFQVSPEVRPGWLVCGDLAARLGVPMRYATARDIQTEIARTVPIYAECTPAALGDHGVRWALPSDSGPAAGASERPAGRAEA